MNGRRAGRQTAGREEKRREGNVRVRVRVPVVEECDISCVNMGIERRRSQRSRSHHTICFEEQTLRVRIT
jgi:hypothetical protein